MSFQQRLISGGIAIPTLAYLLSQRSTTFLLANFFVFMIHNEYSKIVSKILKFNSSESDGWYIETMSSSIFIRIPQHYIIIASLLCNDLYIHLHLIISIFFICGLRIHNFIKISEFLKQKKQEEMKIPVEILDRKLYILSFFQIAADLLQLILFVYPLSFIIMGFHYKQGPAMSLLWCLLAWQTDNGALFLGKLLGKHPFVPLISPKKTWEGVSGGIFLCVITALLFSQLTIYPFNLVQDIHTRHFLMIGLIISVVSIFGDFCESFLKRVADVKDSGNFLPGHGGVLDRLDSLCFSAPVVFLYMKLFLPDQIQLNQ